MAVFSFVMPMIESNCCACSLVQRLKMCDGVKHLTEPFAFEFVCKSCEIVKPFTLNLEINITVVAFRAATLSATVGLSS